MRTCEDGCNGCDECTDWDEPAGLTDQTLKPDIAALTKRIADDPAFAAQVTGEKAAMQPELALFFRDLRNYLLHVIDMSKGEHYLDVVRLNAQALIRRMELLAAPAELERDAMRYRFIRTADHVPISSEAARDPAAYDAAIDKEMAKNLPPSCKTRAGCSENGCLGWCDEYKP